RGYKVTGVQTCALPICQIEQLAGAAGLRIANVFHAGDGNLHPLVLYDAAIPGQEALAEHTAGEILKLCVQSGGSITGEHGVGAEIGRASWRERGQSRGG